MSEGKKRGIIGIKNRKNRKKISKKPVVGIFSFSCCEGCSFEILFIDNLMGLLNELDIKNFKLLKEKNPETKFDLVFIEGAVTAKSQLRELKKIRKNSKFVAAMGACACHGGIPSLRNFIENKELAKYVYNQKTLKDSIKAGGIGEHIKVDYYMYGCPIIKSEFIDFTEKFRQGKIREQFQGNVCDECPRRGKNCFLAKKILCLGSVTRGGCSAVCTRQNVPCVLCRGPRHGIDAGKIPEMALFKNWGLDEKEVISKLRKFC